MPAPAQYTYATATIVAAHTAVLDDIDSGSGAGKIRLRDDSDVLLAEIPLTDPAGSVNGGTGQLTLTASGPDTSADADGTCTYAEITDSDNNVVVSLPASQGSSAVSGEIVISNTSIVTGAEVSLVSAVIG